VTSKRAGRNPLPRVNARAEDPHRKSICQRVPQHRREQERHADGPRTGQREETEDEQRPELRDAHDAEDDGLARNRPPDHVAVSSSGGGDNGSRSGARVSCHSRGGGNGKRSPFMGEIYTPRV
jgi:hypothetical protein